MTAAEKLVAAAALLDSLGDEAIYNVTISEFVRDWRGSGDTGVGDTTARNLGQSLRTKARELAVKNGERVHTNPDRPTRQGSSIHNELSSPFGD